MDNDEDVKEITLDDFNADEQQPAKAESSPAPQEPKAPEEKAEAKVEKEEKTDDTATPPESPPKEETEGKEETPAVETPEDKPTKADERKVQLNTEIRDLVSQRNELKAEIEKKNAEVYQVATEEELTAEGMTKLEAQVEALKQEREMEKYNTQVAEAQLTIAHESQRVLNDFPLFNPDSPEFNKELAEKAAITLDANLIRDPNTQEIIGTNPGFSPHGYYQQLSEFAGLSSMQGQLKAQADTETQLANADATTNVAPPKEKVDDLIDLWRSDD